MIWLLCAYAQQQQQKWVWNGERKKQTSIAARNMYERAVNGEFVIDAKIR